MDKEQNQIEEMKKICTDCIHYEICSLWTTTDLDEDEAYKYCFGNYRPRIPKNAVVMTREEYERLLKEETLCERLGNDIDVKLKYIYELEDKVAQERKETVEKIMNDISSDILVVNTKEYGNIEVIPMERLQEIIQTLGVNE